MVRGAVAPLVIEDARTDPRFADHPGLKQYGIRSYLAVPLLRADGQKFGTLCALDREPHEIPDRWLGVFELLARLITDQLRAQEEQAEQERFISVLAHDLRSPLQTGSLVAGLLAGHADPHVQKLSGRLERSLDQVSSMTAGLVDFARGRFGDGIPCTRTRRSADRLVRDAVETCGIPTERFRILAEASLEAELDAALVTRLVQNLIRNAAQHGAEDTPIHVSACGVGEAIQIAVRNHGPTVSAEEQAWLFQPFRRGSTSTGMGLGLYICSEICRSHGGRIEVASRDGETTFTATLPSSPVTGAESGREV